MLPRLHPLAGVCEAVLSDETHHPAPDSSAAVQQRRSSGTAGRKGDHQKHGAAHRGPDHGNIHTAAWKQTKAAGQGPLTPLHPPETLTPGGCTHGATWPSPGSASRAGRRAREARPGQAGEAREGRAGKGDRQQAEVNGLLQNTEHCHHICWPPTPEKTTTTPKQTTTPPAPPGRGRPTQAHVVLPPAVLQPQVIRGELGIQVHEALDAPQRCLHARARQVLVLQHGQGTQGTAREGGQVGQAHAK